MSLRHHRMNRRHRRGTAALEFGMWFMPLMLILSGIIDLGWYMSLRENVMRAARDSARAAAASFPAERVQAAKNAGKNVLDDIGYDCGTDPISISQPDISIGPETFSTIEIEAECQFQPLIGLVPVLSNAPAFTHVTARFVMFSELQ